MRPPWTCATTGTASPRRPTVFGPNGGLGLRGMRERVEALGGRLAVESAPGQGTTIAVTVPVR